MLSDYNNRRSHPIPLVSESEMLFEKESFRVDKLRKIADKIATTVGERKNILKDLKNKVRHVIVYADITPE